MLAIHGLPTSPALWNELPFPVEAPLLPGIDDDADFSLVALRDALLARVHADTVLLGHDLGGVVAAEIARVRPVRALVLSGTALGPYWGLIRATAISPFHHYFYERHAGRRFLAGSVSPERGADAVAAFPPVPPARMRSVARAMRPSPGLASCLATRVALIWGRDDRWYPPVVARALARATGASVTWVPGGHLCMWEHPAEFGEAVRRRLAELGDPPPSGATYSAPATSPTTSSTPSLEP